MIDERGYSWGNICPICFERITNDARMCREHANKFKAFLRKCYGDVRIGRRQPPKGKGERARQVVLAALANGSLSTPELAAVVGLTVEGVRYACRRLGERGLVTVEKGYRSTWTLVDGDGRNLGGFVGEGVSGDGVGERVG